MRGHQRHPTPESGGPKRCRVPAGPAADHQDVGGRRHFADYHLRPSSPIASPASLSQQELDRVAQQCLDQLLEGDREIAVDEAVIGTEADR